MKIRLLMIGKTSENYLEEGIQMYVKRLSHYCDFSMEVIPDVKRTPSTLPDKLKDLEADAFLKKIGVRDNVILLDENGKSYSSEGFAAFIEKWMVSGDKNLVFIIGGAFGFGKALYDRAEMKISLSGMTFSHQMVRLIFAEQLYRAFTILRNEPYHHK
ncbi:MAG TPA: 23S rRNA (pseudouridine(1915)-N(3))-methyltransferase RlmH [Bacteroidia bacterium]|nr:23S rRNA (pseudouridine(1915)-N(3))-methyltransferase RlmH [Bacteroidia bacterium]